MVDLTTSNPWSFGKKTGQDPIDYNKEFHCRNTPFEPSHPLLTKSHFIQKPLVRNPNLYDRTSSQYPACIYLTNGAF